ncbi:hypothetical protein JNUCC0626_10125 [Lentzea sp. JNUCC 0626]|uniref:hypothetical protein n=1 Tax=Lentzea sp. JNUCC 0626 TaxID=3367513 RepID=UPI003747ADD4
MTTTTEYEDAAPRGHAQTGMRGVMLPVLIGTLTGAIFVTVFLALFHAPTPHGLPLGIVGAVDTVQARLDAQRPGAFTLTSFVDAQSATEAIRRREIYGAFLTNEGKVLVAGANGPSVTATVSQALQAQPVDVLPSSAGDTAGLSTFYAGFGVVLAGFLFGQISYGMAPLLPLRRRLLSIGIFGALNGVLVAGISSSLNALPGNVAVLALVVALVATAVAAATVTIIRLAGPVGTTISSVVLLILGNATGGGTLPVAYLPEWLQWASGVLPVGVGVRAIKGVSYFQNDGLATGLLVLAAWIAVCAGVLFLKDRRQPVTG